jgi:DNA/RNA endonuclease G (NUC1)
MRKPNAFRWSMIAAALALSSLASAQDVRISEIHYDNSGTDVGEAIEISAPAGTDLTGWSVVLYNGSGGATYDSDALSGVVPASCGARGVVVLDYPSNGIQNGAPDGIALVNGTAVVEFLSYEGTLAATNGPANGMTSTDIGAAQNGTEPVGQSLSRDAGGVWSAGDSSFGTCNDDGAGPPPAQVASIIVTPEFANLNVGASLQLTAQAFDLAGDPISNVSFTWESTDTSIATVNASGLATGTAVGGVVILARSSNGIEGGAELNVVEAPATVDLRFNEIHYDNNGTDTGEAIEIEGPAGTDLTGHSIVLYNGNGGAPYNTRVLSGILPASCGDRGVLSFAYPVDGIQNGAPDGMALVSPTSQVIQFLSYEGPMTASMGPAAGMTSTDIGEEPASTLPGNSLQRGDDNVWAVGAASFDACNSDAPPVTRSLQFSGRVPSDPALPVGFEDQLFAALRDSLGNTIPATFTWEAVTPEIATIDQDGVIHALAAGSATFRATADDGTTATYTLPTRIAVASTTAQYANHTEFGEPQDDDPTDDMILERPQFTSSWNPNRGAPNWVAYEIDPSHFGDEDRCDCFTMDDMLPSSLPRLDTNDYTGAGAFHGYGIDRGHLARSFDRTAGSLDNATTFYFSNIIPQAADNNQGPWAALENDLGNRARSQDREVYVLAGAYGNKGTLKNEGKVVIPTHTWKVALIMPRDQGLADVRDYRDVEVIAVIMPNEPGIRNVDWNSYRVTVDTVEAASGYDLLALLEDDVEQAVESGTQPPIAVISGPLGTVLEGDPVSFNATGSVDPNGTIVSYAWTFGDGGASTDIAPSHAFAQDGVYSVTLTITDNDGLVDTEVFSVTVANVAPSIAAVPDGSLDVGQTYVVNGSFTDPGADVWTATVTWGDGSAPEVVPLTGRSFRLTHIYTAGGSYPVSIQIADDDGSDEVSHTVAVEQAAPQLGDALKLIDGLIAKRKISRPIGILLKAQVIVAQVLIGRGNDRAADRVIRSMLAQLDLLVRCRHVSAADLAPLRAVLLSAL